MKVLISVVGRFHAFDLAKQLQKHNLLYKVNSTYPKFITKRWGIHSQNITANSILEFINRFVLRYIPEVFKMDVSNYINVMQAKSNKRLLKNVDIFIGWSGSSLEALIEAKKMGITTILERGSSHYNYQMRVLQEEYNKNNITFIPNYKVWQRELLEYELADYISIPSSFVEKSFIENGVPPSKLIINPYGVDLSDFKQIPKKDSVFRVIYVGGFTIRKGVEYLLKAFSDLNLPNSELIHLGSIDLETKEIIEKYRRNNIKFLGHQPQKELFKFYSKASLLVIMSIEEGLAMVQPQAMACGLPIICTQNAGGENLISKAGEEGFVINIRDVEALKEKLLFLYNNPDKCKQMGLKAKDRVKRGFSWEDYGNRYVDNLKKISQRSGPK